jgi:hypothetical protein
LRGAGFTAERSKAEASYYFYYTEKPLTFQQVIFRICLFLYLRQFEESFSAAEINFNKKYTKMVGLYLCFATLFF